MSDAVLDRPPRLRALDVSPTRPAAAAVAVSTTQRVRWPWVCAAVCFVQYLLVGVWLIDGQGYTIGDANARTTSALVMVLGRDPHLGAMGFYWQPLPMLIRIPFVLVLEPMGATIFAGPISTALCVALVIPVLARIGRLLGLRTPVIATFVGLYALNPVTVFTAANAMSEAAFALVLALVLLGVVRLTQAPSARNLAFVGIMLGVGVATRIEFIPLSFAVLFACLLLVPRPLWKRATAVVLVPPVFVFAMWSWASSLIAGDALYWYHAGKEVGASVTYRPWLPDPLTTLSIVGYVLTMAMVVAPALLVAVAVTIRPRRGMRALVGLTAIAAAQPAFVALQLKLGVSTGEPRYFSLLPVFGCVLSLWAVSRLDGARRWPRRAVVAALTTAMIVGAVGATIVHARPNVTQITRDGAFYAALLGRPAPEHTDLVEMLRPLADRLDPLLARGATVAMDSKAGTLMLLTRHPERFVLPEDRDWEQIMADPQDRFDYAVVQQVFTSGASEVLDQAMKSVQGGTFQLVDTYGEYELYHFEPAGGSP